MSRLTDLIHSAKRLDRQMGLDLESEFRALLKQRSFGLVFERHRPEAVELPQRPVRKGDTVRILPPRGSLEKGDKRLWRVLKIERNDAPGLAHLVEVGKDTPEQKSVTITDLVVVAAFRDPLYPGLVETGRIERGGDKPFHTVINGENFHVLDMLTYTHRHKIDAIYIDPPYNTGAKDWKYNNDYVASDDLYRHSKWLAMMERRLLITKELLNPENSVLIVTIDEKEYLRLGLLLEQTFPEARIQMISSQNNPAVVARAGSFGRADEYIFVAMFGKAAPQRVALDREWVSARGRTHTGSVRWDLLRRSGEGASRYDSPGCFYPIYIDPQGPRVHSVGDALPNGESTPLFVQGTVPVLPIRKDGSEGRWQWTPTTFRERLNQGRVKITGGKSKGFVVSILKDGEFAKVTNGEFTLTGYDNNGSLEVETNESETVLAVPGTQWRLSSHDATQYGTRLLSNLLLNRKFPFPKSLYAVEDALRFFVANKPNAIVLDFFSGSGTTAHAVMLLNRQDGGRRQCISVTNNEVAADEQEALRREGVRPGDPDWERWGICDYITKPRIQAAISGMTPDGQLIVGDYKFNDEFPMSEGFEENAAFFTLTYERQLSVSHNRAFEKVAPLLWLRAGSLGRIIDSIPKQGWDVAESYGVLVSLDEATEFVKAVSGVETVRIAYIVTDDDRRFQMICALLPDHITPLRLYESYLANFEINSGRCA